MIPTFTTKLGHVTQKTDVDAQKIDGLFLIIYEMLLGGFLVKNKLGQVWFFKKTFLLAFISIKVVLKMLFLTFLDANM